MKEVIDLNTKYYENIPVVPLRGLVVFPYTLMSFDAGRDKSVAAIEAAAEGDGIVFLTAQTDPKLSDITKEQLYSTGSICRIKQIVKLPGDTMRIMVEGICRALVDGYTIEDPFFRANLIAYDDEQITDEASPLRPLLSKKYREYLQFIGKSSLVEAFDAIERTTDDIAYTFRLANITLQKYEDRQQFIEQEEHVSRCVTLLDLITKEQEFAKLNKRIEMSVKQQIDKNQKEYFLREQIRAIRKELGETEQNEADGFRERLNSKEFPDEIRDRLKKEIDRFSTLPAGSHETPSLRTFIECMLDMPYTEMSEDNLDIENARRILDDEHYGLEKVKQRILEHLAVAKLTGKVNGQIICFAGPPGVGKTSISSSIAKALGRKFVRMSLGGIRDEAEIRGHRRTYIGAMPGRVIAAMRQAGTINPVLLFDEIDKLSHDFHGDPAAAILEVLDSAQNFAFRDHFLEMPYDLSKVMFITTANNIADIPRPLLDRMEIIEVPSYLANEKVEIAARHLIPKQLKANGLTKSMISFPTDAIHEIVSGYTREAGVRNLERSIASVCRKAAVDIAGGKKRIRLSAAKVHDYLGVPKYSFEKAETQPEIGMVNGLAWTSVGGDTLQIEVCVLKGTGQLQLTGKLGDVMQESARAAITCIRAHAEELGLPDDFNQHFDIHIHVPEGAVPKDGPSAGISMLTAVASALTGIPVKAGLAMTGEITLRGRVLPIGGLREKLLAAVRAGITTVILPEQNRKDVSEVPNDITECLDIIYVNRSEEVLRNALVRMPDVKPVMLSAETVHVGVPA
ncbi:MAG: endopeptidase La [Christensenellaceae bacterium]|nr:endopeptidase La [Christensenellaceae bacterium]